MDGSIFTDITFPQCWVKNYSSIIDMAENYTGMEYTTGSPIANPYPAFTASVLSCCKVTCLQSNGWQILTRFIHMKSALELYQDEEEITTGTAKDDFRLHLLSAKQLKSLSKTISLR